MILLSLLWLLFLICVYSLFDYSPGSILWLSSLFGALKGSSLWISTCCCSVAKLCLTLCDPMNIQLPCPSLFLWICSNSFPVSQWCCPTISPSVTFSYFPQSFLASRSFSKSQLFTSGQSIGATCSLFLAGFWLPNQVNGEPCIIYPTLPLISCVALIISI